MSTFNIPDAFPVFTMPRSWVDPSLSLEAAGLLARVSAAGEGGYALDDFTAGDAAAAARIGAELIAAGILVDGTFIDPTAAARQAARDAMPAPAPYAPDPGRVYYALRPRDGAVKIGHTRVGMATRMRHLVRAQGPLELLAAEPGALALETARHAQFGKLRMPDQGGAGGTEFFHGGPALVRHIETLRTTGAEA